MKKENNVAVLRRDLKAGILRSPYLFYGEEEYLKRHYIGEIRTLLQTRFGSHDTVSFREDFSADAFADAVETPPFSAGSRLILLEEVEPALLPKEDLAAFKALLGDLPDEVAVVICYGDDFLEGPIDRSKRREARIKELAKLCFSVEFPLQSPAALTNWAGRRLAAQGIVADQDALDYLLFLCDNRMTALIKELEKLAALCAQTQRVTKANVAEIVMPSSESDMYEVVSCMTAHDYDKALTKLDACRKNREAPTAVTAALGGAFCELLFAKTAADAGKNEVDALLFAFRIRPSKRYFIRQYLRDAPRIPHGYPEMAVKVLSEVDILQKSSAADPWLLLEQGIERIRKWKG
ncbi:MAG: DNA polymerase III subunit delta [Clostridia bacterium]|nr:DNA polymerase III subunit delta [Clostridia bacterium]